MRKRVPKWPAGFPLALALTLAGGARAADPWADRVIRYDPGTVSPGEFNDPDTALGQPERFSGEASFPTVVSIFSPPFETNELVGIGAGGSLVVEFDEPITNDASHLFGVDFIVFGNGGFIETDFPNGTIGSPPGTFGFDAMRISVSEDGSLFVPLGEFTEGFFPTQGYLDSGPFDSMPGSQPTDFTKPVNPALMLSDFDALTLAEALTLYDGSGGGTPIDIAASGLSAVRFVRIESPVDAAGDQVVNIDGLAAVPEPSTVFLVLVSLTGAFRRKWHG